MQITPFNLPTTPGFNRAWEFAFLATGGYNTTHADVTVSAYSANAGPTGASRRSSGEDITIRPISFANAWEYLYSSPYPNGESKV